MSRNPFGWDYPAGAEHDPYAPWNQEDPEDCPECGSEDTLYLGRYDGWTCNTCNHSWGYSDPDNDREED